MASRDGAALLPLAESIADGAPVDWDVAEAGANADERAVIRQLRVLANLAELHRSRPPDPSAASPAAEARRAAVAPAIGNWAHLALIDRLGGGTFSEVYRAWDRHLEREVALKLLRVSNSSDDPQTSRIMIEGRLLARIHHPNVVTVYDAAVHDQRVGLWMELVRGATLEELLLTRGPFSAREAVLVGIDLCRALAAIHAAGLIHRDVKAQNVMREDRGRIVLMDLGTGREIDAGGRHRVPDLAGTPLYLAPEIFAGAVASECTDLYSLGVLLYHLVTGSFPVRATTIEELQDGHAKGTGVRLRDARADLPTAFVRVVDRALAKDPNQRYKSAGAFEADLVQALDEPASESSAPRADATIGPRPFGWRRTGALAAFAAAALLILVVGWPALRSRRTPAPSPGPIRSIAVLPLANVSGDPSQEYFADGMTDELIGMLGQIRGVSVISRTSAMQFKGSTKPLPEIARALHVEGVLEGSVLVVPRDSVERANGPKHVRINARLIHAGTDTLLWDRTFETVVADVLALQREVAKAVAAGINSRLTEQPQARQPDFDAFNLYLKGRYYWNVRTGAGLRQSLQYFQEAVDRGFAPAYVGLADAYNLLGYYDLIPRAEARERARTAALQALQLDDSLGEAHASLAFIHLQRFEWDAAEAEFKLAVTLKPNYATAHQWYAMYLVERGRISEATAEVNKALELDPLSVATNGQLGSILIAARRYGDAVAQLEKSVRMDSTFARNHLILAEAYRLEGAYDRALAEADMAAAVGGDAVLRGELGYLYAVVGRRPDALRVADDLLDRYRKHEEGAAGGLATVYTGLGDADLAFTWLERARDVLDPLIAEIKIDARFDALRADPRFGNLLATAGLAR